jgi:hypothetical protein
MPRSSMREVKYYSHFTQARGSRDPIDTARWLNDCAAKGRGNHSHRLARPIEVDRRPEKYFRASRAFTRPTREIARSSKYDVRITDHYRVARDASDTTEARKAEFRTFALAVQQMIDERGLAPIDPMRWRRAAIDAGLPELYLPRWRAMSGDELMELYDTLSRARSAGEE